MLGVNGPILVADPGCMASSLPPFMWCRVPSLGPSFTALAGHKHGAGWEAGLPGLEPVSVWDPSMIKPRTSVTRLLGRPIKLFLLIYKFSVIYMYMYINFCTCLYIENRCIIFIPLHFSEILIRIH